MFGEQPDVFEQQIAEIGRVQLLQPLLIGSVKLGALAVGEGERLARRHLLRHHAAILPAIDQAGQMAGRPALFVEPVGLDDLLQQAKLVVRVKYGE